MEFEKRKEESLKEYKFSFFLEWAFMDWHNIGTLFLIFWAIPQIVFGIFFSFSFYIFPSKIPPLIDIFHAFRFETNGIILNSFKFESCISEINNTCVCILILILVLYNLERKRRKVWWAVSIVSFLKQFCHFLTVSRFSMLNLVQVDVFLTTCLLCGIVMSRIGIDINVKNKKKKVN